MGGYQEEHSKQDTVVMQVYVMVFSIDKSFQRFSHPLPGTEEEILTNGDFPYKCKCFLQKCNFYILSFQSFSCICYFL